MITVAGISLAAALLLPSGCNMAGWGFCVRISPETEMQIYPAGPDGLIYGYDLPDGSRARVYAGWSPTDMEAGRWSERRQGLESVRWRAGENGRIDYYIERSWAESAGIPRLLHAWVEASPEGEISDAENLVLTLRSCDPRLCPPPAPGLAEPAEGGGAAVETAADADTAPETEPIPEPTPTPALIPDSVPAVESDPVYTIEPAVEVDSASETETVSSTDGVTDNSTGEQESGTAEIDSPATNSYGVPTEEADASPAEPQNEAEEPQRRRDPVVLTGND